MRSLFTALAFALTIGTAGSAATSGTAEAGYYRYVYKPAHCFNVIKHTHWGPKLVYVCR